MSFTTSLGYTPQYQINKNGTDITGQFNDRVITIKVQSYEGQGQSDKIDIGIDDRDWLVATPATDGEGATQLQVNLGYKESGLYDQGNFAIDEVYVEGLPKSMRLVGHSLGFSTNTKAPVVAAYAGQTVNTIVNAIATAAGVSAVVDPDIGSKTIEYLNQHASSMHLLQALERTYNGIAKFGDGMLSFTQRGTGANASGILAGGFELTSEDFAGWSYKIINRTSFAKVRASYWDKTQHALMWVQSTTAQSGQSTVPNMIKKAYNTQDEAQSAANAMMDSLNRGIITGTITLAKGDPSIHGGAPFTVSTMKADCMNGSFVVKCATHTYTKEGGIQTVLDFYQPSSSTDFSATITDQSQATVDGTDLANETPVTTGTSGGIGSA